MLSRLLQKYNDIFRITHTTFFPLCSQVYPRGAQCWHPRCYLQNWALGILAITLYLQKYEKMKMAKENEVISGLQMSPMCLKSRFKWNFHLTWAHGSWCTSLISVYPEGEGGLCGQEDSNLFLVSERCFPIGLQTNEFVSLYLSSQPAWSEYNTSSLCFSSPTSICDTVLQGRKTTASHMCLCHTK